MSGRWRDSRPCETPLRRFNGELSEALAQAERNIQATLTWLQDRASHWQAMVQQCGGDVNAASAAFAACQRSGYTDKDGKYHAPNCQRQEAALRQAQARLRQAQAELQNAREWQKRVQDAAVSYRQEARRMRQVQDHELDVASTWLLVRIQALREYLTDAAPAGAISHDADYAASRGGDTDAGDPSVGLAGIAAGIVGGGVVGLQGVAAGQSAGESGAGGTTSPTHSPSLEQAALHPVVDRMVSFGYGVCSAERVDLRNDGSGVFKALEYAGNYHDGHTEVAAYRVSELLGLRIVPDTVYTEIGGRPGTIQFYLPHAWVGADLRKSQQRQFIVDHKERFAQMAALDYVIGNADRHEKNWMWDGNTVWAIDHGHATSHMLGELDPSDSTAFQFFRNDRVFVPAELLQRWRSVTYGQFVAAMGTQGRPVQGADTCWHKLQELIDHGGEVTWFLHP